jgi:hypothetical protein
MLSPSVPFLSLRKGRQRKRRIKRKACINLDIYIAQIIKL